MCEVILLVLLYRSGLCEVGQGVKTYAEIRWKNVLKGILSIQRAQGQKNWVTLKKEPSEAFNCPVLISLSPLLLEWNAISSSAS